MTGLTARSVSTRKPPRRLSRDRLSVLLIAVGCVVLLLGGSILYPGFLKPGYILQQLQIASFLGIIATGAMLVILLGEIDLSVPWTITGTAIVVISASGSSSVIGLPNSSNPSIGETAPPVSSSRSSSSRGLGQCCRSATGASCQRNLSHLGFVRGGRAATGVSGFTRDLLAIASKS